MTLLDAVKTAIVFEAIETDEGHDGTVKTATVTAGSTEVAITGDDLSVDKVNIENYFSAAELAFKSGATGATWNGTEWKLTP